MRSTELRFDSIEARSVGSGKFSSSSISSTVLPASERSSRNRWLRKLRKNSISSLFTKTSIPHDKSKAYNIIKTASTSATARPCTVRQPASIAVGGGTRVAQNKNLGGFGQHAAVQGQLRNGDLADRVALFGEGGEKFSLTRDVVMHRNHDRRFDLLDHF